MKMDENSGKVTGYHYTNSKAYSSIRDGKKNGQTALIPRSRFISLTKGNGLPDEAHKGVIGGLLEPEPKSWLQNPEFPFLWNVLMDDICRENDITLLSFEINPKDEAYIAERAHVERELYREAKGRGKPTRQSMDGALRKYWESRVPVFDYDGSYLLPQLAIFTPIEFQRLKVEWIKSVDDILVGLHKK